MLYKKGFRRGGLLVFVIFALILSGCANTTTTKKIASQKKEGITTPKVTSQTPTLPIQVSYQRGIDILLYGNYPDIKGLTENLFTQLKSIGVNSIAINFPFYMDNLYSSSVYTGKSTPTDSELQKILSIAHGFGFSTNLRPILDQKNLKGGGDGWRGIIHPQNVANWFVSYTNMIVHYATLLQSVKGSILTIGAELNSMEQYTEYWDTLIQKVRSVFSGEITYSSNWWPQLISSNVQFWRQLNFISTDLFVPVQGPSVADMVSSWNPYLSALQQAYKQYNMPIVVTELGAASQEGSYSRPWVSSSTGKYSSSSQANYYEAAFTALHGLSFVKGVYIWDIPFNQLLPGYNPSTDTGFNPLGKEAESVIQKNF
ncbi:MAG: glycoside hydrolase family 113 [Patescibacteria group bacterium]